MAWKARDIAQMMQVSEATVSLVLNNKPGVSEKKRNEIIEKIQELGCGYMLKGTSVISGRIGFVVYKANGKIIDESPFFTYILEGLNQSVIENGFTLTFVYLNREMTREEQQAQLMTMGCQGLILFGVEMSRDDLQVFVDSGIPFVVLDNSFQDSDVDSVAINNSQGTSKAIQHLIQEGHRQIGYVRCIERITSFEERYRTYERILKENGLSVPEHGIIEVSYEDGEIRRAVRKYLKENRDIPTAFFAENDFIGCSVVQGAQSAGYKVPEELSVIGFDDRPICTMIAPKLTTISVPKEAFGRKAVELLVEKIHSGREYSLKIEIGTRLVLRDSVARKDPADTGEERDSGNTKSNGAA